MRRKNSNLCIIQICNSSRLRTSPKTIKDEELGEHTGEGEGEIEEEI